ncbi:Putative methyltransferase, LIC12133 family [actinobacterium SCGC AAA044-D11]
MPDELTLWNGIFNSLETAVSQSLYANKVPHYKSISRMKWIEKQKLLLSQANSGKLLRTFSLLDHVNKSQSQNILDFGGGSGWGFKIVQQVCPETKYYILETPESNSLFKDLWRHQDKSPTFCANHNEIYDSFEIFYVNSVLQYLEDDNYFVDLIRYFSPAKLVLDEIVSSDSSEFWSLQNHYDEKIPYRFLNLNELNKKIEGLGYKLSSSSIGLIDLPIKVKWEIKMASNQVMAPRPPMNLVFTKQ